MSGTVTFRNALTGQDSVVQIRAGKTVKELADEAGLVTAGSAFSVRDKWGHVVDDQPASDHAEEVLTVGLPGDRVRGGIHQRTI